MGQILQQACKWILLLAISGCSIHGSFQGLYSYQHKTAKIAPNLIQMSAIPVCDLIQKDPPVVYPVNGVALMQCITPFEKALVYIWRPQCSSDICISPMHLQDFCNTNGVELFIVAEYYDHEMMLLSSPIKRPVFGVDCDHYSSHLTKKYMSGFLTDLVGEEVKYGEQFFFLFKKGCLDNSSDSLERIKI